MAIVRFRPFSQAVDSFRDFGDMQAEVNRLFDSFLGRPAQQHAGTERVWAPAVDMYETKEALMVVVELPGLVEKDINLSIVGDVLSIRGERQWNQLIEIFVVTKQEQLDGDTNDAEDQDREKDSSCSGAHRRVVI